MMKGTNYIDIGEEWKVGPMNVKTQVGKSLMCPGERSMEIVPGIHGNKDLRMFDYKINKG